MNCTPFVDEYDIIHVYKWGAVQTAADFLLGSIEPYKGTFLDMGLAPSWLRVVFGSDFFPGFLVEQNQNRENLQSAKQHCKD